MKHWLAETIWCFAFVGIMFLMWAPTTIEEVFIITILGTTISLVIGELGRMVSDILLD